MSGMPGKPTAVGSSWCRCSSSAFFLRAEAAIVFLTVVAIFGFREFARATALYNDRIISGTVYVGIIAIGVVCWMSDPSDGKPGWYGLFMALPVFVIAVILVIPVFRDRGQGQLPLLALAIVGFVYFGWMFGHLAFLANSAYAYSYLGYLVVAVELNDIAAYAFGKLFGRHPLRSNISPKKTWEGAAGGLAVSLLLPWILLPTFPHFQKWDCLLAGLIVGVGGRLRGPRCQRIQAQFGDQRHGGVDSRPRWRFGSNRQLDLCGALVLPLRPLLPQSQSVGVIAAANQNQVAKRTSKVNG